MFSTFFSISPNAAELFVEKGDAQCVTESTKVEVAATENQGWEGSSTSQDEGADGVSARLLKGRRANKLLNHSKISREAVLSAFVSLQQDEQEIVLKEGEILKRILCLINKDKQAEVLRTYVAVDQERRHSMLKTAVPVMPFLRMNDRYNFFTKFCHVDEMSSIELNASKLSFLEKVEPAGRLEFIEDFLLAEPSQQKFTMDFMSSLLPYNIMPMMPLETMQDILK